MAKDAAKLTRRRALGFAVEDDTGVQESLTGADVALDAIEPEITYDDDGTEREGVGLSSRSKAPGAQLGGVNFRFHLSGSGGASVPLQANLLSCAGLKLTSNVLTPLTDTDVGNTGTFWLYKHGRMKPLHGVMIDASFAGERGKPVVVTCTGRGKRTIGAVAGPRDLAMPTPTHIDVLPPVLKGATFTIGGTTYRIPGFELNLGNDVQLREDITDATGFHAAQVVGHSRRLIIRPEALPLATRDWYDAYEQGTEFAWAATIGDDNGNFIQFAAPKIQLAEPPADEDSNGIYRDMLTFQLNQDGDDGDDELSIGYDLGS